MEKIEFKLDGPSVIAPGRGCILLARFQLVGRQQELGSIFCDYGMLAGRSLQLFNCRAKTFLMDCPVPCDYALKVDAMTAAGRTGGGDLPTASASLVSSSGGGRSGLGAAISGFG